MHIEPFPFASGAEPEPSCAAWSFPELDAAGRPIASSPHEACAGDLEAEFAGRLEAEIRRSFEAGRERGLEEGRTGEREEYRAALAAEAARRAEQLARLRDEFADERDRYFERVEHEVVKLALAVAARILRREAQMDPLLLLGAVRVALGQLDATTTVRLRVPAAEAGLWREAAALLPARAPRPEVVAEEDMRLGDCALETAIGSVDLGVRAQLSEIERGFFDRAAASVPDPEPIAESV